MESSLADCSDPVKIGIACHDALHNGAPAVCVSYHDNGPGLTDEQITRILRRILRRNPKELDWAWQLQNKFFKPVRAQSPSVVETTAVPDFFSRFRE